MSDLEMMGFAAKAAGWTGWRSKHGYWNIDSPAGERSTCCLGWSAYDSRTGDKLPEPTFADAMTEVNWHPLEDDGDALRLAVKLRINIMFSSGFHHVGPEHWVSDICRLGDMDDIRREIVTAAAEIGKDMP